MDDTTHGLFVRESGPPDGPAVVFLHGVGNTGAMWRHHMAALVGYRCLAPDLPGHGRSRSLAWKSREDTAERITRLIEALPGRRAHLVGLSLGGSVAFQLLSDHPELLDHVVIDGCAAMGSRWNSPMKLVFAAISPFVRFTLTGRLLAAAVGVTRPADVADLTAQIKQVDPASFRRAFANAQDVRVTTALLEAPCPTLLVSGEREVAAMHTSSRSLADRMIRSEARVMPGAGHGWVGRHLDVHIAMVRAWIEDRPLPRELRPEGADARLDHVAGVT
jgi:pimeloyl-ACP methyl ester carboxylesterase